MGVPYPDSTRDLFDLRVRSSDTAVRPICHTVCSPQTSRSRSASRAPRYRRPETRLSRGLAPGRRHWDRRYAASGGTCSWDCADPQCRSPPGSCDHLPAAWVQPGLHRERFCKVLRTLSPLISVNVLSFFITTTRSALASAGKLSSAATGKVRNSIERANT